MDITTVFGTVILGSNPGRCTKVSMTPQTENLNKNIPIFVTHVTKILQNDGFEAFLVGGCVRDILMGEMPHDWDVTTNALPEKVQEIFNSYKTICENTFGTVTVLNMSPEENSGVTRETPDLDNIVQITTYRSELELS